MKIYKITTIIIIITIVILTQIRSFRLNYKGPIHEHYTISCVEQIATNNFYELNEFGEKSNTTLLLLTLLIDDEPAPIQERLLQRFHRQSDWSIEIVTNRTRIEFESVTLANKKHQFVLNIPTNFYIIFISESDDLFGKLASLSNLNNYNVRALFVIYATRNLEQDEIQLVLDTLIENMIFKILILIAKNLQHFHLYSPDYRRYEGENCLDFSRFVLLNRCIRGEFIDQSSLDYHDKMLNVDFDNCTMYVFADQIAPFVISHDEGIEIELLRFQAELLNFQLDLTVEDNRFWGTKTDNDYGNFSINYVYKDLYLGIGNVAPSVLYIDDFEFTRYYFEENLVWIVPIADYIPKWRVFTIIFSLEIWALCFALIVITALAFYLVSTEIDKIFYNNLTYGFMLSLSLLIGLSTPHQPQHHRTRLVYGCVALLGVIIISCYTMSLIDYLKNPHREKQISTIDQILSNRLQIKALPQYEELFNVTPQLLSNFEPISHAVEQIVQIARYRNSCTLFSEMHVNYLLAQYDPDLVNAENHSKLFLLPEKFTSYSLTIIVRRGFPYLHRFNAILNRLDDGALIYDVALKYLNMIKRVKYMEDGSKAVKPLTLYHLQGAFAILGFGYLFGAISLICEHLYYYYIIKKKSRRQAVVIV